MAIYSEIINIQNEGRKFKKEIKDETAFSYIALQYLCYQNNNLQKNWYEIEENVIDGSYDGGIDFIYYDDDENKLILGQSKFTKNATYGDFVSEINKIIKTLNDFRNNNTGKYKSALKEKLQNNLDKLPTDNQDNIDRLN